MSETQPTGQGFGYTRRGIAIEVSLVLAVCALLAAALFWAARRLPVWAADALPPALDRSLGEQSWRLLAPTDSRCNNPELTAYLSALTAPLLATQDTSFQFQFAVVDQPSVNAFALPGGFVTVHLGLLEKAESGEEIAGVLAHELAHVTLRHGTRRILRQLGTVSLVLLIFGGTDVQLPATLMTDLLNTAYGRDEESEADERGVETLRAAGLDPLGMPNFFERIAKDPEAPNLPTFLSTHPDPGDRARHTRLLAEGAKITRTLPKPKRFTCN